MARRLSGCYLFSRGMLFTLLLIAASWAAAQNPSSPNQPSSNSSNPNSSHTNSSSSPSPATAAKPRAPEFSPPRSDRVNASDLGNDIGESSSKDSPVDLSPPSDDVKTHPKSSEAMTDAEMELTGGVTEFHTWDPHKAAKSVEVGDFYFKRKNYRAAEDRYREALMYKDNDAIATLRLAVCLDKMERPGEALLEYESYLKILPHGPEAEQAHKAIDRLSQPATNATKSK